MLQQQKPHKQFLAKPFKRHTQKHRTSETERALTLKSPQLRRFHFEKVAVSRHPRTSLAVWPKSHWSRYFFRVT